MYGYDEGLIGAIVLAGLVLAVIQILIVYSIIKAAVRNGTMEAYVKLRRQGLYPPSEVWGQGPNAGPAQYWPGSSGYPPQGR